MFGQACLLFTLLLTESVFAEVVEEDPRGFKISKGEPLEDGAQEYVLTDNNGNFAGSVDMFVDEGYQIDKPNEKDSVCLIRQINDEVTDNVCYVRKSVSHDQAISKNLTKILEHCEDQEIFLEEPQQCDELTIDSTEIGRQKRSTYPTGNHCCHYKKRTSVTCIRTERYCCNTLWGVCIGYCERCVVTSSQEITEFHCHFD